MEVRILLNAQFFIDLRQASKRWFLYSTFLRIKTIFENQTSKFFRSYNIFRRIFLRFSSIIYYTDTNILNVHEYHKHKLRLIKTSTFASVQFSHFELSSFYVLYYKLDVVHFEFDKSTIIQSIIVTYYGFNNTLKCETPIWNVKSIIHKHEK